MSELLKINVNDHTEKKNGLTYLSWAWAWAEVLAHDPEATWEAVEYLQPDGTSSPCMYMGGGSAMVKTCVTIKGKKRYCLLPVMDHRNKAIQNPDAFQVNTAIMRCMTKAISMHGLGLYIYAGEDLPEDGNKTEPFDLLAALDAVEAAQDVKQLELVWKARSAQAKAANDRAAYDALAAAVKDKKVALL